LGQKHLAKKAIFQDLPLMPQRAGESRWRWLYGQLRAAILDHRLRPGARVPSSRNLAKQHGVSRGTVVAAVDHLRIEGYLETRVGAGAFVATTIPDEAIAMTQKKVGDAQKHMARATLSKRGLLSGLDALSLPASHSLGKAFRAWEPAIDLFPINLWSRIAGRVLRRAPRSLYGQGDAKGYLPLRRAIAEYIGGARGVHCDAEQIIVTSGAQQALDLVSRLLLDPGDSAWLEDPGYPGALRALRAAGAEIAPVPVDHEGLDVKWGLRHAPKARLAYVTPANQFPLGTAMSLERRLSLLNWAATGGSWIIEDDYDSEYRYFGRPLAALQSLDRAGCLIYVGTFTKMLFNALRLGFLVLPLRLVEPFAAARTLTDQHSPTLDQAILAEFILDGHFGHHVRRMRQTYAERMEVLCDAANQRLGGMLQVQKAASGMRTIAWLQTGQKDIAVAERARARGLEVMALSQFSQRNSQRGALVLGFAGCTPAELRRGVDVLAMVLDA
jgi:GntR family transcriptional regulator/MocR family aminotransferase